MDLLFIASTGNHAGQSLIAWAVARGLREKGINVGFFKPFGNHPIQVGDLWTDRDALHFKDVLHLEDPLSDLCPYVLSEPSWREKSHEEIQETIKAHIRSLSEKNDFLLVMGSDQIFSDTAKQPVPDSRIVDFLNADLLLVHRFSDISSAIYSILSVYSLFKGRVRGIIINRVAVESMGLVGSRLIPLLAEKNIQITACIPEDPILSCRSLRDVLELLDGEVLWGDDGLENRPVGGLTVGSADLREELLVLKRVYNKILLLEPSPSSEKPSSRPIVCGILLTGGRKPPQQVLDAAKRAGVPLLLIRNDTFQALDIIERNPSSLSPRDENKVRHFVGLLNRDGALSRFVDSIPLA